MFSCDFFIIFGQFFSPCVIVVFRLSSIGLCLSQSAESWLSLICYVLFQTCISFWVSFVDYIGYDGKLLFVRVYLKTLNSVNKGMNYWLKTLLLFWFNLLLIESKGGEAKIRVAIHDHILNSNFQFWSHITFTVRMQVGMRVGRFPTQLAPTYFVTGFAPSYYKVESGFRNKNWKPAMKIEYVGRVNWSDPNRT